MDRIAYNRLLQARHLEQGLCVACSRPHVPGKKMCSIHIRKRREYTRRVRAQGICPQCHQPSNKPGKVCTTCTDRALEAERIRKADPEYMEAFRLYQNSYSRQARERVIAGYGNKCACCGMTGLPFLTLDHVNNDGNKDRLARRGGKKSGRGEDRRTWYNRLIREGFPPHIQVLCWNCNMAKAHYGGGVCPHKL